MEGQDLSSKAPIVEQLTVDDAATKPRPSESNEDNEDGGTKLSDEHRHRLAIREGKKPVGAASGPASGKENGPPKSILEKTAGTTADTRPTELIRSPSIRSYSTDDDANGLALGKGNGPPQSILEKTVGTPAADTKPTEPGSSPSTPPHSNKDDASSPTSGKEKKPLKSILKKTGGTPTADTKPTEPGSSPSTPPSTRPHSSDDNNASSPTSGKGKEKKPLKSILKKTGGTIPIADTRPIDESGMSPLTRMHSDNDDDDDDDDNGGGVRLFQGAAERLKARDDGNAGDPVDHQGGGPPVPRLVLDTEQGLVPARTNSNGEPAFGASTPREGGSFGIGGRKCKKCGLM